MSEVPNDRSVDRLPEGILRFVRASDSKSGWAEFADGRRLPVRYRHGRDGVERIRIDTAAIRRNKENHDRFLRELGEERLRLLNAVYTVRDFVERDGHPEANERALVEVRYAGEDGVLTVDLLDELGRDPVRGISNPAVSVALNRWRQILLLEHHASRSAASTTRPRIAIGPR